MNRMPTLMNDGNPQAAGQPAAPVDASAAGPPARPRVRPSVPPKLPSDAVIILPNYEDVAQCILESVITAGAHLRPNKLSSVLPLLWADDGSGVFDGRFSPWTAGCARRRIGERIAALVAHYSNRYEASQFPTAIMNLAKRIHDESAADQTEANNRQLVIDQEAERRQNANNEREGALGLLPRGRGTGIPAVPDAGARLTAMREAAGLLAQNPRSQNNNGEYCSFLKLARYFWT